MIRRLNLKLHRRVLGVEPEELHALMTYRWKRNVREREHELEQAMILGDGDILGRRHLPEDLRDGPSPSRPVDLRDAVRQFSATTSSTCWSA